MPEAIVDHVEHAFGRWFKVFLKGFKQPILVHWNWFASHGNIYERVDGYFQDALKPGDRVSFEIAKPPYPDDKENIYVKNLHILKEKVASEGGVAIEL